MTREYTEKDLEKAPDFFPEDQFDELNEKYYTVNGIVSYPNSKNKKSLFQSICNWFSPPIIPELEDCGAAFYTTGLGAELHGTKTTLMNGRKWVWDGKPAFAITLHDIIVAARKINAIAIYLRDENNNTIKVWKLS